MKVDFDLNTLLGDILSTDGLYVDLLSCNEYTLWYLMRQAGLKGYVPVLRTHSFLTRSPLSEVLSFGLYQDTNLNILMANLLKFFGVGIIHYDKSMGSIEEFVKKGIARNKFVYTLYDHYFNTLSPEPRVHDYHGHPITGCDNERQIYLSLVDGKFEVRYSDIQNMSDHCYELNGSYVNKYFYLDVEIEKDMLIPWKATIVDEIRCDCRRMISDWMEEIGIFQEYISEISGILNSSIEAQREFALNQRLLFNTMAEGMHGNFVFKLRLLDEILEIDTHMLQQRFMENRKKGTMIANMFRKAVVLLDDGPEIYAEALLHTAERISDIFVEESSELLKSFKNLVMQEGLIENDNSYGEGSTVC